MFGATKDIFIFKPFASTVFTCYPTALLGTNYCLMTRPSYLSEEYSEFGVMATKDDTTVTITPSASANLAGQSGTNAYIETLQQGQTYQFNSSGDADDVTGTRVTADKPIGVFAGVSEADVPDGGIRAGNPLEQEQLPIDQWGTNVVAMPFAGRTGGDLYRVLAYTNTTVTITNSFGVSLVTNLAAGTFCDTNLDGWVWFQANKPIQVAQFANGTTFDNVTNSEGIFGEGDPCEVLLLSAGHYLTTNVVATGPPLDDSLRGFDENFLNLIVAQSATNTTFIDGSLVASTNFVSIGTSGYYGAQITLTNSGTHTVSSSQPVDVEVYGWGLADAYSYFGGIVR